MTYKDLMDMTIEERTWRESILNEVRVLLNKEIGGIAPGSPLAMGLNRIQYPPSIRHIPQCHKNCNGFAQPQWPMGTTSYPDILMYCGCQCHESAPISRT